MGRGEGYVDHSQDFLFLCWMNDRISLEVV